MESALNQIRMRANQSEEARQDVIIALRDLDSCLENTHETIHRIGHMVCLSPFGRWLVASLTSSELTSGDCPSRHRFGALQIIGPIR